MQRSKQVTVVKTAQMANTLKLMISGHVVGSVVVIDPETAELRDKRDRLLGTFANSAAAVAEFEEIIELEKFNPEL